MLWLSPVTHGAIIWLMVLNSALTVLLHLDQKSLIAFSLAKIKHKALENLKY